MEFIVLFLDFQSRTCPNRPPAQRVFVSGPESDKLIGDGKFGHGELSDRAGQIFDSVLRPRKPLAESDVGEVDLYLTVEAHECRVGKIGVARKELVERAKSLREEAGGPRARFIGVVPLAGPDGLAVGTLTVLDRKPRAPIVLGHEVAGVVAALGDGAGDLRPGDRIVATHHVPCLSCRYCARGHETACEMLRTTGFDPGGFADYIRLPAVNVQRGVLKIPDQVSDDAASMVEPLGCAVRAQRKMGIRAGDSVVIVGAGVSGSLHLLAAHAQGGGPVFVADIQAERRRLATGLGAEHVLDAAQDLGAAVRAVLGHGADHAIVCAGPPDAVTAPQAAAAAMRSVAGVIMPFPGGIARSGSKVGSRYSALPASTNHVLCPTLRAQRQLAGSWPLSMTAASSSDRKPILELGSTRCRGRSLG